MKICISSTGNTIEYSNIDTTIHRCAFFLIVDKKANSLKAIYNTIRERPDEIGAMVGQIVANEGIDAVITTDIGPRAFEIFASAWGSRPVLHPLSERSGQPNRPCPASPRRA